MDGLCVADVSLGHIDDLPLENLPAHMPKQDWDTLPKFVTYYGPPVILVGRSVPSRFLL